MKIIKGYVKNFGCLSEKELSFESGLNAVCSENGTGKSTLIAFMKAMLFGIGDTKRTSLFDNERRRYAPWNKGSFGGSLTVEVGDKVLRIERSFGKRPSEDSFRLFDEGCGRESFEYTENIGEEILGIDADGAERTLFLTEKNLPPTTDSPTLSAAVSGAVGNLTESDRLSDALLILDKQRKIYTKRGGGGIIDIYREKITAARRKLTGLDALVSEERKTGEEISLINERINGLDSDSRGVRSRQSALVGKRSTLLPILLLISCMLTVAFSISGVLLNPFLYIGAPPFGILCAVLTVLAIRKRGARVLSDYERLDYERADIDSLRVRLIEERAELIRHHERTVDAIREMSEVRAEYEELTEKLKEAESRLFIIQEAAERLKEANDALARRHVGTAKDAFVGYLGFFSESEGVNLDTELKITRTEGGETHPFESYSRAVRDLYSFAARLSAADAIFGKECPFLVLDDPFCAFDNRRLATALDFIRELSKTRQIIYFTASKSRLP